MDHRHSLGAAVGTHCRTCAVRSQFRPHDRLDRPGCGRPNRSHAILLRTDPVSHHHDHGWPVPPAIFHETDGQGAVLGGALGTDSARDHHSLLGSVAGTTAAGGGLRISQEATQWSGIKLDLTADSHDVGVWAEWPEKAP